MDLTNLNKERQSRRPSVDLGNMVYGKVPPQERKFEEAVLGAILLEKPAFDIANEILKAEHFYVDGHQKIFSAMTKLRSVGSPIDIYTVGSELKKAGELELVGGDYELTRLTNSVITSANLRAHAQGILGTYILRNLLVICGETIGQVYDGESTAQECFHELEKKISESSNLLSGGVDFQDLSAHLVDVFQNIISLKDQTTHITGISSGFSDIDKITHGWQAQDLIIVAARPSVGKTAFSIANSRAGLKHGAVGLISLEMSARQLTQRMLSAESGVFLDRIKTGRMGDTESEYDFNMSNLYENGIQKLAKVPLYIYDGGDSSWSKVRSICRSMVRKHKVKEIIIDYLQLMTGDRSQGKGNREQEISTISRESKLLAKELNIPFIILSQLSREVEKRSNPKPQLSDLRESGAIEQDADIVLFLHSPTEAEINENAELKNFRYYTIAKHRNGSLDSGGFGWFPEIQLMQDKDKAPPNYFTKSYQPTGFRPIDLKGPLPRERDEDAPF